METVHGTRPRTRWVAGAAVATLAALASSLGVLYQKPNGEDSQATERPFWANDATASNLAVVELYRSGGASWSQGDGSAKP